jgi:hypothetical protein
MNKKDVYDQGYNTGYDIASSNIHTELNFENFSQEKLDEFISNCSETESEHYRQFSPFEFFAHDINECFNSDGLWESYDAGVYKGICKRVKEFKKDNKSGYQG